MLHRINELIWHMVSSVRIDPSAEIGNCKYCGLTVRHKDGSKWFFQDAPAHFSCRRILRTAERTPLLIQASYLRIAEAMGRYAPDLFHELENHMTPYIEHPTPDSLCRLVALILVEMERADYLSEFSRHALKTSLSKEREAILSSTN